MNKSTVDVVHLAVALIWQFGEFTKLNVCHLGYNHGFLSIQHSKLPIIKNLANCIFRMNRQIFDSPIIPCMQYFSQKFLLTVFLVATQNFLLHVAEYQKIWKARTETDLFIENSLSDNCFNEMGVSETGPALHCQMVIISSFSLTISGISINT